MSKLLAVTAFCHSDLWLAEKRSEYMRAMGYEPTHDLLLIGDSSVSDSDVERVQQAYKGLFKEVYTRRIKESPQNSQWPHSCNHVWRITTRIVAGRYGNPKFPPLSYAAWFYFEPDITPLHKQFMGIMEQQYLFHKKQFMGYVGPVTVRTTTKGVVKDSKVDHMNGAGVYPISTAHYSKEALLSEQLPWDVAGFAGNELLKVHRIPKDVYLMGFRSKNFVKTGEHTFDAIREVINNVGVTEPYSINTTQAILHHGCKDGSLMDAVHGESNKSPKSILNTIKKCQPMIDLIPVATGTAPIFVKDGSLMDALIGNPIKIKELPGIGLKFVPTENGLVPIHPQQTQINIDHAAGMKWRDLLSKYKIAPRVLKSILPSKK